MGTFSKQNKRSLHRRGKQFLKSKIGLRRKTTLLRLKSNSKLFQPSIVLPKSLQLSTYTNMNSIQMVHTSINKINMNINTTNTNNTQKKKSSPRFSSPFQRGFSLSPRSIDDRSTSTKSSFASVTKKIRKKISLKKALGIKKKKEPSMEDQVNALNAWATEGKPPETILIMDDQQSGGSGEDETADTTNPNTPLSNASSRGLPATPSNESSTGLFEDTDDENDGDDDADKIRCKSNQEKLKYSEARIQIELEQELKKLDEKIQTQKAERRAIAKEQLESAVADEEKEKGDVKASFRSLCMAPTATIKALFHSTPSFEPQNLGSTENFRFRFLSLVFLLLPTVLAVHWILSRESVPPYDHDIAMKQAQAFFGTPSTMEGITVVLSETRSKLGSTIGNRFAKLGATVASIQDDMNCNDLGSVAKSVDSIIKKHQNIDFLVHTGNLCLVDNNQDTFQSLLSKEPTVQGHNILVGGNYLSAFLATQKILPSLEQSKYGTLVQFTSKTSALTDGQEIESLLFPDRFAEKETTNYFSSFTELFHLPLRFASIKLSETLQFRVLTRAYPNIRTMEISSGWIGIGEGGADDFFSHVFERDEEASPICINNSVTGSSADNEDLQDNLYEWSQNAVWKWVAPPSRPPVTEMILGSPPSREILARSEQEQPSTSVTAISAMVTSSTLALLVTMKGGWSSGLYSSRQSD